MARSGEADGGPVAPFGTLWNPVAPDRCRIGAVCKPRSDALDGESVFFFLLSRKFGGKVLHKTKRSKRSKAVRSGQKRSKERGLTRRIPQLNRRAPPVRLDRLRVKVHACNESIEFNSAFRRAIPAEFMDG